MRDFPLGIQTFARAAAETGAQAAGCLVTSTRKAHPCHRSTAQCATTCSENRYPSPLARPNRPPCGSRRPFSTRSLSAVMKGLEGLSPNARSFAYGLSGCCFGYATLKSWARLSTVKTNARAVPCVNPFFFSPSSRRPASRPVCKPTGSVRLPVQPPVRLSPMPSMKTALLAQRSVRSRAPIATTQVSVTDHSRLNGRCARPLDRSVESFSDVTVRGAFSCLKLTIRQRALARSGLI